MCRAGLTDDSRRRADGTAHKMNWTKPLGRGGRPLEDLKNVAEGLDEAGGTLDPSQSPWQARKGVGLPVLSVPRRHPLGPPWDMFGIRAKKYHKPQVA